MGPRWQDPIEQAIWLHCEEIEYDEEPDIYEPDFNYGEE